MVREVFLVLWKLVVGQHGMRICGNVNFSENWILYKENAVRLFLWTAFVVFDRIMFLS